jgi:hypothetical protein
MRIALLIFSFCFFAQFGNCQSIQLYRKIFSGQWVQAAYFENLRKTKSPAHTESGEVVELGFGSLQGDSIEVGIGGIHEGGGFNIYFDNGKLATASGPEDHVKFKNPYKLSYHISGQDTFIYLGQIKYFKVRCSGSAFECMINRTLFSGDYICIDSSGAKRKATFTDDGRVIGLNRYIKYWTQYDFTMGDIDIDYIALTLDEGSEQDFGYVVKGKDLLLYNLKNADLIGQIRPDNIKPSLGKLKYKLSRIAEK